MTNHPFEQPDAYTGACGACGAANSAGGSHTSNFFEESGFSRSEHKVESLPPSPVESSSRLSLPEPDSPLPSIQHHVLCIEHKIYLMNLQRLQDTHQPLYIPPMAKTNLQARDEDIFALMDKVDEFLARERQVMLILGDSGAGKSTFNKYLESKLLQAYTSGGRIPLFINLPAIRKPEKDMVSKQLRIYNFSEAHIQKLKQHRQFVVICDGYDESQLAVNLHFTNHFNRPGQWNIKLIISCRTQYLGHDYRDRFVPQRGGHYNHPALDLFQEAVIVSFSRKQIHAYVDQYVPLEPRTWTAKDYLDRLTSIPSLLDLVKNPFLLSLALETLPDVTESNQDLSTVKITRVQLYDTFVNYWLDVNKRRLQRNILCKEDSVVLDQLLEAGFILMGVNFSTRLASAIFDKQGGNPVVHYIHFKDKKSWKADFFTSDPEVRLLRESSPLTRSGNLYQFLHRSMLEYFLSLAVIGPTSREYHVEFAPQPGLHSPDAQWLDSSSPLLTQCLQSEPSIIQFLCDRLQSSLDFKKQLLAIIVQSKIDALFATAAANAITILVRAGVTFHGHNLRGIRIPGADLSNGQFDSAQFQDADLTGVNLTRSWLRKANFSNAQMNGVHFGELPYLEENDWVRACCYSPNGKMLAVCLENDFIKLYNTSTWAMTTFLERQGTKFKTVAFSPDSQRIISGGWDNTVRLWDGISGEVLLVLKRHVGQVNSVAFSPCGNYLASASEDATVLLWNAETGETLFVWRGHTREVTCVKFTSGGHKLVSGGWDGTIRFWDVETGEPGVVWESSHGYITSLDVSIDGAWIVTGDHYGTVQIWDVGSGTLVHTVQSHTHRVTGVVFCPNGQWIATSSDDSSVRLWSTSTGTLQSVLTSDGCLHDVSFAPANLQVAAAASGMKVQLWNVDMRTPSVELPGHTEPVLKVAHSPDGRSIISCSRDGTIRQWDSRTGVAMHVISLDTGTIKAAKSILLMALSPDTSQIATYLIDSTIRIWNRQTGVAEQALRGHTGIVHILGFSPCSSWLVSVSSDSTLRLWSLHNPDNGIVLARSGEISDLICSLAFSPSGLQLAICDQRGTVRVYDTQARRLVQTLLIEEHVASAVAYSPSNKWLAIGTDEGSIFFWETKSKLPGVIIEAEDDALGSVSCMAFSSCGDWIASGTRENKVVLWRRLSTRVERWSCVSVVHGFFDWIIDIAWNPAVPLEFVTGCKDRSVRSWRVAENGRVVSVRMLWGSNLGQLCASDMVLKDVVGLDPVNRKLLVQRGASDDL